LNSSTILTKSNASAYRLLSHIRYKNTDDLLYLEQQCLNSSQPHTGIFVLYRKCETKHPICMFSTSEANLKQTFMVVAIKSWEYVLWPEA